MPAFRRLLTTRRDEVFETLDELHEFLAGCGLSDGARNAVEVASEELLANVWKYAYPEGEPGEAALEVIVGPDDVLLEIVDAGAPFDPTRVPAPPPLSLDSARGGRGIHLVRSLSRSFTWRRDGIRNVVTVQIGAV